MDAFVLPSRGEGFGLTGLEAMATDLPVIATNLTGQADYLDPADSLPLDYRLIDAPGQVNPYVRFDGQWAEPDEAHLRRLLRWVYEHREEAVEMGSRAAARVRREGVAVVGVPANRERTVDLGSWLRRGVRAECFGDPVRQIVLVDCRFTEEGCFAGCPDSFPGMSRGIAHVKLPEAKLNVFKLDYGTRMNVPRWLRSRFSMRTLTARSFAPTAKVTALSPKAFSPTGWYRKTSRSK
jgi:hypothetical protein